MAFKISESIAQGRLEIDLKECSIHTLPEEIFDIPGLQILDCSKNFLTNDVFTDLKDLPNLYCLNLTGNLLTSTLPIDSGNCSSTMEELCFDENVIEHLNESLGNYSNLVWFSVRKNCLQNIPGSLFSNWSVSLQYLDLRDNKLTVLPDELGDLLHVKELYLSNNLLTTLPDSIGKCSEVEILLANKNQITSIPLALNTCTNLQHLDFASNKLIDVPPVVLSTLVNLQDLFLGGNKITDIPSDIGNCVSLQVLSLSSNSLKSLPESIGNLSNLREIYCGNNPMSSLPPTITGWVQLQQGIFRNCKLKALPPGIETTWKAAKFIDVRAKGKKDTICKVSTEVQEVLKKTRMVGVVWTKPKKAKGKK